MTKAAKAAFVARMAAARKKSRKKGRKVADDDRQSASMRPGPAKRTKKKKAVKKTLVRKRTAKKKAARKNPARKPAAKKTAKRKVTRVTKSKSSKRPARRRNSAEGMDAAVSKFEEFHGKPPSKIVEYEQTYHYPAEFAEMGKLKELRVFLDEANPEYPITGFGACQAGCTPDGANIYFIGGDQAIDLKALDIASDKDFVELGSCVYIAYHTVKGFHDFAPTLYYHEFGEEDGITPTLAYDRLNRTLFLVSGNYRVRPAGIEN
jgi:hypothetical protein